MAVTLKGQSAIYEGTSEDMKPSDAAKNAIFQELDTGIDYYYNGTAWNEIPKSGGGGGTGTDNYNELNNKPSINGTVLSGNKSLDNLGIQAKLTFDDAPTSGSSNPVKSGGVYSALGGKQDAISDLQSIRNGAAAGATAVQPQAMAQALAAKQDTLNPDQLAAVNSGITAEIVAADTAALIELVDSGAKNKLLIGTPTSVPTGLTCVRNNDGTYTVSGTLSAPNSISFNLDTISGNLVLSGCPEGGGNDTYLLRITKSGSQVSGSVDTGTGSDVFTMDGAGYALGIRFAAGAYNDLIFKPMICTKADWDISQSYQPYRPSYDELIARVEALENA